MLGWLIDNLATVVIATILFVAVAFAVRSVVRAKQAGHCSCGCSACTGCDGCCGSGTKKTDS